MNIAVVVNPAARAGAHTDAATKAVERLRAHGHTVTEISGGSAAETSTLIRTAVEVGTDAVAVVGGDGTVNLAAQELAGSGVPLGMIPTGTGNDFAAHFGVPRLAPEHAADVIHAGDTRAVDLAQVIRADGSTQVYATVLACGFDSAVNDRANRMRWPKGDMRYNIAILLEFVFLKGLPFTVHVDDERVDGPLIMASVGNTRTYGGNIPICPDADVADGLLDLTVVRPSGRLHLLRLLPTLYKGTHVQHPEVETYRGRRIRLEAANVTAYADGDPIGTLPLTIDALPGALTLFAPAADTTV
ncbi:MAG: diacylglycerol kinase [Microbacterium sp.]|uniref:diacylglycerol kinase n=1 Tax=Microbacterium sp. TaxID=51671 RepID=UPI003A85CB15